MRGGRASGGPATGPRGTGLVDRSSAPRTVANRSDERRIEVIAALRRLRMTSAGIAEILDMALATVSGILTRIGMGKPGRRSGPRLRTAVKI
jgi:hypothetical protein